MNYCTNVPAERHLVGGALLFWEDFAPYADRVHEEFFSDAELLYLWRSAVKNHGDVVAAPPTLYDKALEAISEYNGASPSSLIARLEEVVPRRRLQHLATDIIRALDAGDDLATIVVYAKTELEALETPHG